MEVINELLVLILSWNCVIFLDIYYDPEMRYKIGWTLLLLILVVTILNFGVAIVMLLKSLFSRWKLIKRKLLSFLKSSKDKDSSLLKTIFTGSRALDTNSNLLQTHPERMNMTQTGTTLATNTVDFRNRMRIANPQSGLSLFSRSTAA